MTSASSPTIGSVMIICSIGSVSERPPDLGAERKYFVLSEITVAPSTAVRPATVSTAFRTEPSQLP